jgi:hypothetical protein
MTISNVLKKFVASALPRALEKVLDERLPSLIEEIMQKKFRDEPNIRLTHVGFNWAFYLALREHWANIDGQTAVAWLWEYIDVPYGHPDYDWTPAAAKLIASEYVLEFGE